jgi:glycosyltransferase involved in cell wall biosynthesis
MRLRWVTHAYPRSDGDLAGHFLELLAGELVTRGHQVEVFAPADEGRGGQEMRGGVRVCRLRYAPASWETLAYRGTMAEALRRPAGLLALNGLVLGQVAALRRNPAAADLVHAHWWVPGGVAAWAAARLGGLPYVVTLHGTDVRILERSSAARRLARRVLRGASAVTAVSSYLARRAAAVASLEPERISVLPMPAEVAAVPPTDGGAGIVTVGRLTRQKRIHLVLEAAAALAGEGRPMPVTIIGDGPERSPLESLAGQLGLQSQVHFAGRLAPAEIAGAIAGADLFAFAGVGEGLGLVAAEALMAGVPVAAVESGGIGDVVPRVGAGRLVEDGDDESAVVRRLALAIRQLMADPGARPAARAAGEEWRRRLDARFLAAAFEGVYQRAITGTAR